MLGSVPYLRLASLSLLRARKDDATMTSDWMMEVDERFDRLEAAVVRLETTVCRGFADLTQRMDGFSARMDRFDARMDRFDARMDGFEARLDRFDLRLDAMNNKIDVTSESLRDQMTRVTEVIAGAGEHLDRTAEVIRKEHEADRRLIHAIMKDRRSRLASLEEIVHRQG